MLEVQGIHTYYGLSHILFDVSLKVKAGQVVCLLGRNGAGKTTTFRSIMGLNPPARGHIRFDDMDVTGTPAYQLVRRGMGWVPDDRRIFADLTVGENLEIAERKGNGGEQWDKPKVYDLFPALKEMDGRKGGLLSGGEQKMLAIARALMTNPQFVLLDEPTEGVQPSIVGDMADILLKVSKEMNIGVLVAEQNLDFCFTVASRAYVISKGSIQVETDTVSLRKNKELQMELLGV